jgi:hypothetical protein
MIPTFLEDGCESGLSGPMIFTCDLQVMGDSKILLDLVPEFENGFVSFCLGLR